jgi:hypothetical protein
MTLVELLVVFAIIGILLAVSVPILKPMLESRKTYDAAQVVAGAFRHARIKSIQEGKSFGIRLIPYTNAPTTSVELRLLKGRGVDVVNPFEYRVKVVKGNIDLYHYDSVELKWVKVDNWTTLPELQDNIVKDFEEGYKIQFNRLGRFFRMEATEDGGFQLFKDFGDTLSLTLPDVDAGMGTDAMEYRITKSSGGISLAWLPPVMMPYGTIVDLVFSGGETVNFEGNPKSGNNIPSHFSSGDDVVVLFSPAGHVDILSINKERVKVNEMLYFCVGNWDRQLDIAGNPVAEDGKSNLQAPATYWVTLHPKTGVVRITENAPIKSNVLDDLDGWLRDARKFASENFFEVGGE